MITYYQYTPRQKWIIIFGSLLLAYILHKDLVFVC